MTAAPPSSPARAETDPSAAPQPRDTLVRVPGRLRRALGWVLVVALVLIVGAAGLLLAVPSSAQRDGLDPERPGPGGMQALAQILRQQGVTVDVVRTRAEAERRLDEDTTLVMSDPYTLSDAAVAELTDAAHDVVLTSPAPACCARSTSGATPSRPPRRPSAPTATYRLSRTSARSSRDSSSSRPPGSPPASGTPTARPC